MCIHLIYIYIYVAGLCSHHARRSTQSQIRSASVRDAVTIADLRYDTPSPPIKSLGFRGFDSSKLLILKGGNCHFRIIL